MRLVADIQSNDKQSDPDFVEGDTDSEYFPYPNKLVRSAQSRLVHESV